MAPKDLPKASDVAASDPTRSALLLLLLVFLSLQSLTVLLLLDFVPSLQASSVAVTCIAVGVLCLILALAVIAIRWLGCRPSWSGAFFAVICWSSGIDLILSLSFCGATRLGRFYSQSGEPYFLSAWGVACLAWDGVFHLLLQLRIAHSTLLQGPPLLAGLLWSGSILNSMPVLLLGAATGSYAADISVATALNAPYVALPIAYLVWLCSSADTAPEVEAEAGPEAKAQTPPPPVSAWATVLDVLLGVGHAAAVLLHIVRAAAALGSAAAPFVWWAASVEPTLLFTAEHDVDDGSYGFVRVQLLLYLFHYVPLHVWAICALCVGQRPATLAKAAMVTAGGYAQGQACLLASGAFRWVGYQPMAARQPATSFFVVNLALPAFAFAYAARCAHPRWTGLRPPKRAERLKPHAS